MSSWKSLGKSGFIILTIFLLPILVFFESMTIKSAIESKGQLNAIAGGVVVDAILVSYRSGNGHDYYTMLYEYYDDGTYYFGGGPIGVTREKAKALKGTTVKIYIDGKGNSIMVGHKPGHAGHIAISVCLGAVLLADVVTGCVLSVLVLKKNRRAKISAAKGSSETADEETTNEQADETI